MDRVITVIIRRDGRHEHTLTKCSNEDAQRWADEGFEVFRLALRGQQWAVNHFNSGKVFSNTDASGPQTPTIINLLTSKGA